MNTKEVRALINQDDAAEKMYDMFRQGIIDGATLPEVTTDAEDAAHSMLGCDNYSALREVYNTAIALREDPHYDHPAEVIETIELMADSYLREQVDGIIAARGPIGNADCHGED
jgi:hypothetical protein